MQTARLASQLLCLLPMKTQSILLLGSFALAAGCMKGTTSTGNLDSAASVVDSSDSTEAEGNMMMSAVDGSDATGLLAPTAAQVAARIAANVALRWSACATAVATGANVAITYNDCTGPRGLVHVTGELDLAVTVSLTGGISVHGTGTGLTVNRATLDIDTDATYAVSGTTHTLTVKTDGTGVGPRGNAVDHTGNYTITWDTNSQCGSIAGQWSTEIGTASRSNDVNLMRCAGSCPSGTVAHKFLGGASLTLTFDGSAVATWSASTGASGSVDLLCTAQ